MGTHPPERIRASIKDDRSPRALRAALPAEDHAVFDEEYRAALDEARDTCDLTPHQRFQDRWWGVAMLKADLGVYQALERCAEDVRRRAGRGEPTGGVPWDDAYTARLKARRA